MPPLTRVKEEKKPRVKPLDCVVRVEKVRDLSEWEVIPRGLFDPSSRARIKRWSAARAAIMKRARCEVKGERRIVQVTAPSSLPRFIELGLVPIKWDEVMRKFCNWLWPQNERFSGSRSGDITYMKAVIVASREDNADVSWLSE